MKVLSQIKCAILSRESFISYYARQSTEKLEKSKKILLQQYLVPGSIWVMTLVIMSIWGGIATELLVLYSATMLALQVSLMLDYRKRKKIIEQELENRR